MTDQDWLRVRVRVSGHDGMTHRTAAIVSVIDCVRESGLAHRCTADGAAVEGPRPDVRRLAVRCLRAAQAASPRLSVEIQTEAWGSEAVLPGPRLADSA